MSHEKQHYRHVLLHYFNNGVSATDAHRELEGDSGEDAPSLSTCYFWYKRFAGGDFDLDDKARSGQPRKFSDEDLIQFVNDFPHSSTRIIALALGVDHTIVARRLHDLGFRKLRSTWIPHVLSESLKIKRVESCKVNLAQHEQGSILKQIITVDESWVLYNNVTQEREWCGPGQRPGAVAKPEPHQKKMLISVFWNHEGIVHLEFLPRGETVKADFYCEQLKRVHKSIKTKYPSHVNRKGVFFLQDNARPHTANVTKKLLNELKWQAMPHPPYSPDLAPSDYHLFRSLKHCLKSVEFDDDEALKRHVTEFFKDQPKEFYAAGINKLPSLWQSVIDVGGEYLQD